MTERKLLAQRRPAATQVYFHPILEVARDPDALDGTPILLAYFLHMGSVPLIIGGRGIAGVALIGLGLKVSRPDIAHLQICQQVQIEAIVILLIDPWPLLAVVIVPIPLGADKAVELILKRPGTKDMRVRELICLERDTMREAMISPMVRPQPPLLVNTSLT